MTCRFCRKEINDPDVNYLLAPEFVSTEGSLYGCWTCITKKKMWCNEHNVVTGSKSPCPECVSAVVEAETDNLPTYVQRLKAALPPRELEALMELDQVRGDEDPDDDERLILLRNIVYQAMVDKCSPAKIVERSCQQRTADIILPPLEIPSPELVLTSG